MVAIGSTAPGMVLGCYGLIAPAALFQRPGGEPWQAGVGQYLAGLILGVPSGGLLGLGLGVALMRPEPWALKTWLGLLTGLAAGPFVAASLGASQAAGRWGVVVVVAASGTLGGLVGGLFPATKGRPRRPLASAPDRPRRRT